MCTRYAIPAGYVTVVIQDQDIDFGSEFDGGNYWIVPGSIDRVVNLRNNTLTIPVMNQNVSISNNSSIGAENAAVTCNDWENVETNATENMKIGDEFYVTAKEGYTVRVTGDVVALGNDEYRINGKNVTITVTKKGNNETTKLENITVTSDGVKAGEVASASQDVAVIRFEGADGDLTDNDWYFITLSDGTEGVQRVKNNGLTVAYDVSKGLTPNVSAVKITGVMVTEETPGKGCIALGVPKGDGTTGSKPTVILGDPTTEKALQGRAVTATPDLDTNLWYVEVDGEMVWFAVDEDGWIIAEDKFMESVSEHINEDGNVILTDLDMDLVTVKSGTAKAESSSLDLGIGAPKAIGAKLPEKVVIDDAVTTTVTWYYPDENGTLVAVTGDDVAEGTDPGKYVARVSEVTVDESKENAPNENATVTVKGASVSEIGSVKDLVETLANGDAALDTSTGTVEDFTPVTKKYTVTVKVDNAERVTVTGDGEYAEGTKAEIKVEAEDGFVIATVNGEAVEEAMKKIWTKTIESVTADVTFTITTTEDAAVAEPATLTLVGGLADDNTVGKTINVKVTGKDQFEAKNTEEKADDTGATTYHCGHPEGGRRSHHLCKRSDQCPQKGRLCGR